jgi:nucleoid-associated protein YgaU
MALEKMTIKAYKDSKFKTSAGSFDLQFNPTEYSQFFNSSRDESGVVRLASGVAIDTPKLAEKQEYTVQFYLDSTGVAPGCDSVPDSIKTLKGLCVDYHGTEHTSYFIKLVWGSGLEFKSKCTSIEIDYVLFKSSGDPVRARIKCTFESYEDPATRAARHNTSSPDLSHVRIFKAGDSLPLICHKIYGNSSYYLQVAKANGITNFRNIAPGKQILFPRLEK